MKVYIVMDTTNLQQEIIGVYESKEMAEVDAIHFREDNLQIEVIQQEVIPK